jgi:2-oxoglutarate dehydrogenase E2 component (dihydrolipoamide succinyltransferase)
MAEVELIMPKMGESVAEATIIKWLKAEGDKIEAEESIIEIATDKVDSEIPSPEDGIVKKLLFNEDDVVQVGQVIAIIETEGSAAETSSSKEEAISAPSASTNEAPKALINDASGSTLEKLDRNTIGGKFLSPLVRSIAEAEGISADEIEQITGSGKDGRVTKDDMMQYLKNRGTSAPAPSANSNAAVAPSAPNPAPTSKAAPAVSIGGDDEIIEMDRMRKLIAEHMVRSKHTSPHVTSFVEADVTNMVLWRNKVKNKFLEREGEKITFTPIIIEAVAKAIKDLPMINVSVDGDKIIKRGHINIGMATALPSGNLIVPVIKDADQKNLIGITKAVNDLANRARNNKLESDEVSGGTFTVTNVGTFGNVMGTPIINQPQAAIMAIGTIKKKPAVIETPFGDTIGIRHMMFLSLSYDHRVVDGSLGGSFVRKVADYLENFDLNRDF